MKVIHCDQHSLPAMLPCVLTLGTFDGLHLAHQALIARVRERAAAEGLSSLLLSFEPHPRDVLHPQQSADRLSTLVEKQEQLDAQEVDQVLLLRFDHELAALEARDFIREVLARLNMRWLVIGHNHAFGHNRSGNRETLSGLAASCAFHMEVLDPVEKDGVKISSTRIRQALREGNLELATSLLGRPYGMRGTVVHGSGRGRGLGYPTANLVVQGERKLLPAGGVYGVRARVGGAWRGGMLNLGARPTFDESVRVPELHVFDLDADLYGECVELEFLLHVRDTIKFESVDQLRVQLGHDRHRIQDWLSSRG